VLDHSFGDRPRLFGVVGATTAAIHAVSVEELDTDVVPFSASPE